MTMAMKLFNTLSGSVEELECGSGSRFTMYFCGPTVYNYAHIGNFRTYLLQDVLRRTMKVLGYCPCVARNITDVDDKTIANASLAAATLRDFTDKWIEIFHCDCDALNILPPDFEPRATDHIGEQIAMISSLLGRGFAYVASDGSCYFKISSFPGYGALSKVGGCALQTQGLGSAGRRNLADEYDRESACDFALWKARKAEDGGNFWSSPWGNGRPGWHIECSAMAKRYLGDSIDLHSGGVDLKFPHHENEIAQSECANGLQFSRYWMHIAHLLVDGEKMSKSLGNLRTLGDILGMGYSAQCLRYALIAAHYSQQLNFTENNLVAAKNALNKLRTLYCKIAPEIGNDCRILESCNFGTLPADCQVFKDFNGRRWKFFGDAFAALLDDLNTPLCLGNIFKAIHGMSKGDVASMEEKSALAVEFFVLMYCLGLNFNADGDACCAVSGNAVPVEVEKLANLRWTAKQSKNFAESDRLRCELLSRGWTVMDGKDGYKLEREKF